MSAKCPACDWDITDGGVEVVVAGKTVTACCDECAARIAEHGGTPT